MKTVFFLFLLCAFTCVASAQSLPVLPTAPGAEVIEQKWSVRKYFNPPPIEDDVNDPFRANKEANRDRKARIENARQNKILNSQGRTAKPLPTPSPQLEPIPVATPGEYIYKAKIENTGSKKIRLITWEYVFYEKNTDRELGRRKFVSEVSIAPGKTKTIEAASSSPPTDVINATFSDKNLRDQYSEQVIIHLIEYTDGSFSKAASK